MAKSPIPSNEEDYAQLIIDYFTTLPFEQQKWVIKEIHELFRSGAQAEREELLARLKELDELTGLKESTLLQNVSESGKQRANAAINYYDPATGNHSTGRGSWKKAPWVQEFISKGGDIEKLRVGPDNPLPPNLS